jgi:hypothetical protein
LFSVQYTLVLFPFPMSARRHRRMRRALRRKTMKANVGSKTESIKGTVSKRERTEDMQTISETRDSD